MVDKWECKQHFQFNILLPTLLPTLSQIPISLHNSKQGVFFFFGLLLCLFSLKRMHLVILFHLN